MLGKPVTGFQEYFSRLRNACTLNTVTAKKQQQEGLKRQESCLNRFLYRTREIVGAVRGIAQGARGTLRSRRGR
jgi:hypothetical protein